MRNNGLNALKSMNWQDEIMKSHKGQSGFFKQIEEEQLKTNKMENLKIKFNDLYFDKTLKLHIVSIFVNENCFDYYMDIDVKEDIIDYSDYCRYNGECNISAYKTYEFKAKITKLYQVQIFDENSITEINKETQELLENYINDYLSEFPEVYKEAIYI